MEEKVENLVQQQINLITGIIEQVRALIGAFELIESIMEDKLISFKPFLKLVKNAFKKLLEIGNIDDTLKAEILEEIELLEEEIDYFSRGLEIAIARNGQ